MSIFDNLRKKADEAANAVKGAFGAKETFTFTALPESLGELKALPEAALDTPFKTAALTVCALCVYAAAPSIGEEMLNFLKGPEELSNLDKQFLKDRFADTKLVPFSYFAGATPENDYTPAEPFTLTVETNPYSFDNEGYAKLFLKSGGADSPREVVLRKKGEQWFLWQHQGLLPGIRKAKSEDKWA
ncbi:MAG: hypothetical protein IJS65_05310 [Clostridia bacterium]|nr:hypothetical protein [Clostridia bacterium]